MAIIAKPRAQRSGSAGPPRWPGNAFDSRSNRLRQTSFISSGTPSLSQNQPGNRATQPAIMIEANWNNFSTRTKLACIEIKTSSTTVRSGAHGTKRRSGPIPSTISATTVKNWSRPWKGRSQTAVDVAKTSQLRTYQTAVKSLRHGSPVLSRAAQKKMQNI